MFIATQLNSRSQREQLSPIRLSMNVVIQLTQFVGRDIINKNTTDLAVRCLTGSVELSCVAINTPQECTGNYSTTSNNIKLAHWPLMGGLLHLVQRGGDWAGPQPTQTPPRCTKRNSSPINSQCTNHRTDVVRCCAVLVWLGLNTMSLVVVCCWWNIVMLWGTEF